MSQKMNEKEKLQIRNLKVDWIFGMRWECDQISDMLLYMDTELKDEFYMTEQWKEFEAELQILCAEVMGIHARLFEYTESIPEEFEKEQKPVIRM